MALTNAERQRKFRANRDKDLVRRQNYLTSERQRYQKDKDRGVRASTKLLSEREKRILRRKWKKEKKVLRAKQKKIEELITPPMSPVSDIGEPSRQRKQSTKKIKRDQAKCYRENKALRLELEKMKKRSEMYRKRYLRNQKKAGKHDTPRSKTRRIIRNISNKTVKRTLLFQTALMEQMRFWYKSKKSAKKHLAEMISSGAILKKYKFLSQASSKFGLRIQKRQRAEHTYLSLRECQRVRNFFERDDISYVKTGKKQTVTYKKEKKQRRILKETLRNVYLKYISQNSIKIGFSTFCRLRPFWVVFPRPSDRSTCLCKLCENTQFMATALKKAAVIENDNLNALTCRLVCSEDSKTCMYAQCEVCKDTRLSYDRKKNDDMVQCSQWVSKKEKRTMKMNKKNIEKEVVLTVKL